jgi:Cof subfamily protein (haloacid dehalogenase superfamily)
MTRPARRLYISDLDGTLLADDATLSETSRSGLLRILRAGVPFTVASARSIVSIRHTLGDLPLTLPVIEINGAFITNYATARHLAVNAIGPELVEAVYQRIDRHGCVPILSAFDGSRDRVYYSTLANPGMEWYYRERKGMNDDRLTPVESFPSAFDSHIVAFTVIDMRHKLLPLAAELLADLPGRLESHFFENPYSPGWWWLTIHDITACKSRAVKTVAAAAGFDLKQVVVFGDNLNDVKMFQTGCHPVAVANATDDLKRHAAEIIGTNQTDSVVRYILRDSGLDPDPESRP